MRMSLLHNCTVYSEMLMGSDLDNFHNFFHQLLMLRINHVVLLLMSRLVHIFSSTMLSFVSTSSFTVFRVPTSSAIAIKMLPVFRFSYPSSTLAHHWLQNCAPSVKHIHHWPSAPLRSIRLQSTKSSRIFQTCNRPTIDLLPDSHDRPIVDSFPDFTNSFSNSFDSSSGFRSSRESHLSLDT